MLIQKFLNILADKDTFTSLGIVSNDSRRLKDNIFWTMASKYFLNNSYAVYEIEKRIITLTDIHTISVNPHVLRYFRRWYTWKKPVCW